MAKRFLWQAFQLLQHFPHTVVALHGFNYIYLPTVLPTVYLFPFYLPPSSYPLSPIYLSLLFSQISTIYGSFKTGILVLVQFQAPPAFSNYSGLYSSIHFFVETMT